MQDVFTNENLTNNEKLVLIYLLNSINYNIKREIELTNEQIASGCSITTRSTSSVIKSLAKKGKIKVSYYGHFRKIKISH